MEIILYLLCSIIGIVLVEFILHLAFKPVARYMQMQLEELKWEVYTRKPGEKHKRWDHKI